jgi:hypothetical protein
VYQDGSIRQVNDFKTTETFSLPSRKLSIISNTGLQLESLSVLNVNKATVYNREWQLPKNGSLLIKQLKIDSKTGFPDFDHPNYYALSATSETLISVFWIRKGFKPYPISKNEVP